MMLSIMVTMMVTMIAMLDDGDDVDVEQANVFYSGDEAGDEEGDYDR